MDLGRAWAAGALRASAATLLAPLAIVVALAVVALGGGLGGLGSLRQLVAGPPVPSAGGSPSFAAPSARGHRGGSHSLPVIPAGSAPAAAAPAPRTRHRGGPQAHVEPPASRVPSSGGSPGGGGGGGGNAGGGSSPAPPPPGEKPQPSPARQLGDQAKQVTGQLPAPAGPAAGQIIDTVVNTADQVLPPPPPVGH
jgi:hypothetical protein